MQFEKALQITETAFGPDDPRLTVHLCRLGQVCAESGDLPAAVAALSRAVHIVTAARGPDHPMLVADLEALAVVQEQHGDVVAAATSRRNA